MKLKNKVILFGRGSSKLHYNLNNDSQITTIGFNCCDHKGDFLEYVVSTQNRFSKNESYELINLKSLKSNFKSYKVGSVDFHLGSILAHINTIALNSNRVIDVELVGFDFDGYTADDDYGKLVITNDTQRRIDISSQRIALQLVKKEYHNINIRRLGFDSDSDADPRHINYDRYIKNSHIEIVAEITTNHHGSSEKLEKLIRGASKAGADYVKLQKRDVKSFYTKDELNSHYSSPFGKTFNDYRTSLELSLEQLELVSKLSNELNIGVFFSVLDLKSYYFLKEMGYNRFKLPSTVSNNKEYLKKVSKEIENEFVISTGMTDLSYEDFIINEFKNVKKLYLLQCTSSYPTFFKDANIGIISHYNELSKKNQNIVPGFSSHDVGSLGSILAVGCGAKMIEKHIKIGINEWSHFDDCALDVETAFVDFVRDVRTAEKLYGSMTKRILNSEFHKY